MLGQRRSSCPLSLQAEAMAACTVTQGCSAIGAKLLPTANKDGSIRAALYNASAVRDDTHVKPTLRQVPCQAAHSAPHCLRARASTGSPRLLLAGLGCSLRRRSCLGCAAP